MGLLGNAKLALDSILTTKGDDTMIAMLWAQMIILGKKSYSQVPKLLKAKVAEILTDSGMEELITE